MSFLSFLHSIFSTSFFTTNTHESEESSAAMDEPGRFPRFSKLPAELRHMIITEALHEHEKATHRVVMFDPLARRIFPTKELATMASPLLSVNSEFRSVSLKAYTKVKVLGLAAPEHNQFGDGRDWYIVPERREYMVYNSYWSSQLDVEVFDEGVHKVRTFSSFGVATSHVVISNPDWLQIGLSVHQS
jgi:hypothetical protein